MDASSANPRVALVTGAGRGIGAAIARRLAADGCHVAVCDLDEEAAGRTAAGIDGDGGRSVGLAADVTSAPSVHEAVRETERRLGAPDILVNNAGVISVAPFSAPARSYRACANAAGGAW